MRVLTIVLLWNCMVLSTSFVHNSFVEFPNKDLVSSEYPVSSLHSQSSMTLSTGQQRRRHFYPSIKHSMVARDLSEEISSSNSNNNGKKATSRTRLRRKSSRRSSMDEEDFIFQQRGQLPNLPPHERSKKHSTKNRNDIPAAATVNLYSHNLLTVQEEQAMGRDIFQAKKMKEKMAKVVTLYSTEKEEQDELFRQKEYLEKEQVALTAPYSRGQKRTRKTRGGTKKRQRFNGQRKDAETLVTTFRQISETEDQLIARTVRELAREADIVLPQNKNLFDSDFDVNERLGLEDGKEELAEILWTGVRAREMLMESNFRLVVSIARKWCNSYSQGKDESSFNIYLGSTTHPSLDEAIQEGMVGLAKAADRFDYKRNLKFSTYATYWITNSIRTCFQDASTGSLRVPTNFHLIRQRYHKVVKQHYDNTGGEPMPMDLAAEQLGIKVQRLQFILSRTDPLHSIDAPFRGPTAGMGGRAGAVDHNSDALTISQSLSCSEASPQEKVEMSLLRECLESAMAAELSPHERDIIRLKHGLDDGVSKSAREVVEILGSLSVSDVTRSEKSAFRKLRSPYSVHTYNLLAFLDYIGVDAETFKKSMR